MDFEFYILCKNEELNISKCIESLLNCNSYNMNIIVLDSGSTDNTLSILKKYPIQVRKFTYENHCQSYNDITQGASGKYCGIIDADMEVSLPLLTELLESIELFKVILSPVKMYTDGNYIKKGSLYPPKPIFFRTGESYFESVGHGERLKNGVKSHITVSYLHHNDLKPYSSYLNSQVRYADSFLNRSKNNQLTYRDRLRLNTPLLIILVPLYSLIIKGGIFFKTGWVYALDRLIAEAIMYRKSLSERINKDNS